MSGLCEVNPSRRAVIGAAGALFAASFIPRAASAAGARDPRLIAVVLRGALDGLSAVPPLGDPDYAGLRGEIALAADGPDAALRLDPFFGLHPAMPHLAQLYAAGEALLVHAVATGYRGRSHFDGQDVLESGQPGPGETASGWLNRLVGALPSGERIASPGRGVLGVGPVPPLIARGPAPVTGWAPDALRQPPEDLADRVLGLYARRDPVLAEALRRGLDTDRLAAARAVAALAAPRAGSGGLMRQVATGAARLMAADDGPRVGALAFEGWDTHANEGGATGRLARLLGDLDDTLADMREHLGPRWADTVVMILTEFGRTAPVNGTVGTDHGTGTVAILAGGAVKGGRVLADWPGLKSPNLRDGRDLRPTLDLRGVAKGVLTELFDVSPRVLSRDVFPDTAGVLPVRGLISG